MEGDPVNGGENWFLAGLVSFLIGHLFFMFAMSARSYELLGAGIPNDGSYIRAFVLIYVMVMVKTLIPGIKDDNLKVGVIVYSFIIGRMLFWALVTTIQENDLLQRLKLSLQKDAKTHKVEKLKYIKLLQEQTLYGLKAQSSASIMFVISDSILGYSKFVDQQNRIVMILGTYFYALIFFAISANQNQICVDCFSRSRLGCLQERILVDFDKSGMMFGCFYCFRKICVVFHFCKNTH